MIARWLEDRAGLGEVIGFPFLPPCARAGGGDRRGEADLGCDCGIARERHSDDPKIIAPFYGLSFVLFRRRRYCFTLLISSVSMENVQGQR